jgi:hypothetical protein
MLDAAAAVASFGREMATACTIMTETQERIMYMYRITQLGNTTL